MTVTWPRTKSIYFTVEINECAYRCRWGFGFHMKRQTDIIQILPVFIYFIDSNNINWIALLTSPIVWANMLLVVFDNCEKKMNFAGDWENLCDRNDHPRRIHNSRSGESLLISKRRCKIFVEFAACTNWITILLRNYIFSPRFFVSQEARSPLRLRHYINVLSGDSIAFCFVLVFLSSQFCDHDTSSCWRWCSELACVEQHSADIKTKSKTILKNQNWYTQVTLEFTIWFAVSFIRVSCFCIELLEVAHWNMSMLGLVLPTIGLTHKNQ